jgi:hypothetical protein
MTMTNFSLSPSEITSILAVFGATAHYMPDAEPPKIFLHCPATLTICIGSLFHDPGAYALDARSTRIVTYGLAALLSAASGVDMDALGPAASDGTYGPWIIAYKAIDSAGNESPILLRTVHIDASCGKGDVWCPSAAACVPQFLWTPAIMILRDTNVLTEVYVPPQDSEPPSLQLRLGAADIAEAQIGATQIVEAQAVVGMPFRDPGWQAVDAVDGNLTDRVSSLGLSAVQDAVTAGTPTLPRALLVVRYSVADRAGNTAAALRLVHILCSPPAGACSLPDGSLRCTVGGVCDIWSEPQSKAAAVQVHLRGPAVVLLAVGSTYNKCTSQQPLSAACDLVRPGHA